MTLSPSDEAALIRRYQAGDGTTPDARRAGDALLQAHRGFIFKRSRRYMREGRDNESILQEARIGFLAAVANFDPARGTRLLAYAQGKIRGRASDWIEDFESPIRVPANQHYPQVITSRKHHTRSAAAAARVLHSHAFDSTERPVSRDSDRTLGDTLVEGRESPEESIVGVWSQRRMEALVAKAMRHLDERQQQIIRERFLAEAPAFLRALGVSLGISHERVRQLQEEALGVLRKALKPQKWKEKGFEAWIDEASVGRRKRAA